MDNTDPQQNTNPSLPIDITPVTPIAPVIPATTSPWQTPPMAPTPPSNVIPSPWQSTDMPKTPVSTVSNPIVSTTSVPANQSVSPWQSTPILPPIPTEIAPTPSTPPIVDVPMPVTNKGGIPKPVMGVLMLFLVAGIAGGTFLLSRGVSSSKPISPNAPSSEPKAFDPNEERGISGTNTFDPKGTTDCTNIPNTSAYGNRCVATVILPNGEVTWAPGAIEALEAGK